MISIETFKKLDNISKYNIINDLADGEKTIEEIGEENFGDRNILSYIDNKHAIWNHDLKRLYFTNSIMMDEERDAMILYLYEHLPTIKKIIDLEENLAVEREVEEDLVTKSFKVGKDTWDRFGTYCERNNLQRSIVLTSLIKKYLIEKEDSDSVEKEIERCKTAKYLIEKELEELEKNSHIKNIKF